MAFSGSPPDKSLAYRASMVSFPVSIKDAPCDELVKWVDSPSSADLQSETYSRYWFGSSAVVRILSSVTSGLEATRRLIFIFWLVAFAIYLSISVRRVGLLPVLLFVGPLFMTTDFSSALKTPHTSLSFLSAVFFGICATKLDKQFAVQIIFLSGVWLPFFDPLTHPVLYFFVVAGPLIIESAGNVRNAKIQAQQFVGFGLYWTMGYVISWLAKWTFAAQFGEGISVFQDALSQALFRSTGKVDGISPSTFDGVFKNFAEYLSQPFSSSLITIILCYAVASVVVRLSLRQPVAALDLLFKFGISLTPIAVFVVLRSHSSEHEWMTYRTLSVSFGTSFACLLMRDQDLLFGSKTRLAQCVASCTAKIPIRHSSRKSEDKL